MNNGNSSNDPLLDPEIELDILLSRAVSGDRDALAAVRARGASDPSILEELAMWQADELRLARAAREIHAVADTVALPPARPAFGGRVGLGWAVAALICSRRCSSGKAGCLSGFWSTATRTPSKSLLARSIRSRWPRVRGSKLPGYRARMA